MEVFRIAREKYAGKLIASGKKARWNKDGQDVLYASAHRSLATLELTVRRAMIDTMSHYTLMVLYIPDDERLYSRLFTKDMPSEWRDTSAPAVLQEMGSEWYESQRSMILQVPSVIIPQEFNFLINTKHPDFSGKTCKILKTEEFFWDSRLIH